MPAKIKYQIQLNTTKINEDLFYKGKKGTYLNIVLFENEDGEDQYGQLGFAIQETTKEQRDKGIKGEILGNYKKIKPREEQGQQERPAQAQRQAPPPKRQPPSDPDLDPNQESDIPFNHEAHVPR